MNISDKVSKFQKFEVEIISRAQIKQALYNPRFISEGAKKRLRKVLRRHGLVETLVWNRRTGNLVGGHQRLEALDYLEKSEDYDLHVAVIDVDDREEKILNVQLNNPSVQGDWDPEKLGELLESEGLEFAELGFTESDMAFIFEGDERFAQIVGGDNEEVQQAKDTLREIKADRKAATSRMAEAQTGDFYFIVVCEDQGEKDAILKRLKVPIYETYVSSAALRRGLKP